jgi:hypothetical protein
VFAVYNAASVPEGLKTGGHVFTEALSFMAAAGALCPPLAKTGPPANVSKTDTKTGIFLIILSSNLKFDTDTIGKITKKTITIEPVPKTEVLKQPLLRIFFEMVILSDWIILQFFCNNQILILAPNPRHVNKKIAKS